MAPAVHLKCSMHFSFQLLCPADPTVSNDNAEINFYYDEEKKVQNMLYLYAVYCLAFQMAQ